MEVRKTLHSPIIVQAETLHKLILFYPRKKNNPFKPEECGLKGLFIMPFFLYRMLKFQLLHHLQERNPLSFSFLYL